MVDGRSGRCPCVIPACGKTPSGSVKSPGTRGTIALPVKLVTYDKRGHRRLGALTGGRVVDLPDAVGHPAFPSTLESLIRHHGGTILDIARESLEREDVLEFEAPHSRILPPLHPSSIRAFDAFQTKTHRPARSPLYSRWDHAAVLGPDEEVPWPSFTTTKDAPAAFAPLTAAFTSWVIIRRANA